MAPLASETSWPTKKEELMKLHGVSKIEVTAYKARNLDTWCYRGCAPLAHLAMVSQPDVFDQITNPDGLQRDLSPKHASDAYEYAHRPPVPDRPRAFPEIVLNVRDKKAMELEEIQPINGAGEQLVKIRFDLDKMTASNKVYVSRVDGNHRLCYADGDDRRDPVNISAPFQIHIGLTREQERSLFVDINSNQKGLNTSHLAVMQSRLTPEEHEIKDNPDRWIAKRLAEDAESPWHGLIHMGGSKKGARTQGLTRLVNFTSIRWGVNKLLAKSQYIHDLTDIQAQYILLRNYWQAVKVVFAQEWADPKKYLILKNIGVWSLSILGGTIIDRCLPKGRVEIEDMAFYLKQARTKFDWSKDTTGDGAVSGMSGNRAALIIAASMAEEMSDETGANTIRSLQERLLASRNAGPRAPQH
jgi:DGQHR domain-containing protein